MDIDKARQASVLIERLDNARSFLAEAKDEWSSSHLGKTTITVSRHWLPYLIEKVEAEVAEIEKAIEEI